jgi:hypothetical protein
MRSHDSADPSKAAARRITSSALTAALPASGGGNGDGWSGSSLALSGAMNVTEATAATFTYSLTCHGSAARSLGADVRHVHKRSGTSSAGGGGDGGGGGALTAWWLMLLSLAGGDANLATSKCIVDAGLNEMRAYTYRALTATCLQRTSCCAHAIPNGGTI